MTIADRAAPSAPPDARATPLRVGVIGLGFAGTTHLKAFEAAPGVEVVALAGQEADRLAALGAEHRIPVLAADWQDVVARDDVDIVSIGVPNALHHPIAVAALQAGKHVFCEKPLAISGDLAAEMVAAARANDRVLEVAYNHRRRADVRFLQDHLATHPFGPIYHARASWLRRSGIPGITSWFTDRATAGGGPLIDLGVHVLDIALSLMGEPKVDRVSAVTYDRLGAAGLGGSAGGPVSARGTHAFGVEDFASALLRLDTGASILLQASWASYSKANEDIEVELLGERGGARLFVEDYATSGTVTLYTDVEGAPTVSRPSVRVPAGHHARVIDEFLDTVRNGEARTGEDRFAGHHGEYALHRSRIVDAVYASAAAGHEVGVEVDA